METDDILRVTRHIAEMTAHITPSIVHTGQMTGHLYLYCGRIKYNILLNKGKFHHLQKLQKSTFFFFVFFSCPVC